jgi:hypothetical protein
MKRKSADARKRQDELVANVRHVAEEIRPLTDSVDSLYLLLQHVWQNRDELFELLNGFSERETVRCERCPSSPGLAEAVTAGWKELRNESGKYWGICPPCHEAVERDREVLPAETLFCTCCDATTTSLAGALRAGWQCIVDDEGNERGNYAGMCPACIEEEEVGNERITGQGTNDRREGVANEAHDQKRLF